MGGEYVLSTYWIFNLRRGGNDVAPVIMAFLAQMWESMREIVHGEPSS
jgi:hypothetical protein